MGFVGSAMAVAIASKLNNDGKPRRGNNINKVIKDYVKNYLHIWCCIEKKIIQTNEDVEVKNKEAARIVIRNVLKALKRGQSSADFVADNNLFEMLM